MGAANQLNGQLRGSARQMAVERGAGQAHMQREEGSGNFRLYSCATDNYLQRQQPKWLMAGCTTCLQDLAGRVQTSGAMDCWALLWRVVAAL